MSDQGQRAGKMPESRMQGQRDFPRRTAGANTPRTRAARMALLGLVVLSVGFAGCIDFSGGHAQAEALSRSSYVSTVQGAIGNLDMVFAQADQTMKAFQSGWIAPEGAAAEFSFLHKEVVDVKTDINKAQPPAEFDQFHRQLGRSVTLTQQAMDAMQTGFSSGDSSFFTLAQQKLTDARNALGQASSQI
jgi:hypothetical protein